MRVRYGDEHAASVQPAEYGEVVDRDGVEVTLVPAGHVLGSAQAVVRWKGMSIVVSGDYKRTPDPTCAPFEPVKCDIFVSEATFGLPVFTFPTPESQVEELLASVPGYLRAVRSLGVPAVTAWADLLAEALSIEVADIGAQALLPLALRAAPPPLSVDTSFEETLDVLVTPVRSGVVLTQLDLQQCASRVGIGFRRGERRYALKAMLEQDAPATLAWFVQHAGESAGFHAAQGADPTSRWWAVRALATADVLREMLAGRPVPGRSS